MHRGLLRQSKLELGFNPSVIPWPFRGDGTQARYVAVSRGQNIQGNNGFCDNPHIQNGEPLLYKKSRRGHDATLPKGHSIISVLDGAMEPLAHAKLVGRGELAPCGLTDTRLLVVNGSLFATHATHGAAECKPRRRGRGYTLGYRLSRVTVAYDGAQGSLTASARLERHLTAGKNSAVWDSREVDFHQGWMWIDGKQALQLPSTLPHVNRLHGSGQPLPVGDELWFWTHFYPARVKGSKYLYGSGYRQLIVVLNRRLEYLRASSAFCLRTPCPDIEFVMNSLLISRRGHSNRPQRLHVFAGIDDCEAIEFVFDLDAFTEANFE